jgi:hypothetical protein
MREKLEHWNEEKRLDKSGRLVKSYNILTKFRFWKECFKSSCTLTILFDKNKYKNNIKKFDSQIQFGNEYPSDKSQANYS